MVELLIRSPRRRSAALDEPADGRHQLVGSVGLQLAGGGQNARARVAVEQPERDLLQRGLGRGRRKQAAMYTSQHPAFAGVHSQPTTSHPATRSHATAKWLVALIAVVLGLSAVAIQPADALAQQPVAAPSSAEALAPSTATSEPAAPASQPAAPTSEPAAPTAASAAPVEQASEPAAPTATPIEQAAAPTNAPVAPADRSTDPAAATDGTAAPVDPAADPGVALAEPAADLAAAEVDPAATPIDSAAAPVDPAAAPASEPVVTTAGAQPVADASTPTLSALDAGAGVDQCNNALNADAQTITCNTTITNNLTGDPTTTTQTVCTDTGGAQTCSTTAGTPVQSVKQCDGSGNAGGSTVTCTVTIINNVAESAVPALTDVTVEQCVNSGQGGGSEPTVVCDPANTPGAPTPATVSQCNGSGNGGGGQRRVTCSVTGDPTTVPIAIDWNDPGTVDT